jgi:hypothetical protein
MPMSERFTVGAELSTMASPRKAGTHTNMHRD